MALEVRELVIRAYVNQGNTASAQTSAGTQSSNTSGGVDQMIETCVEKVLEIVKAKLQR